MTYALRLIKTLPDSLFVARYGFVAEALVEWLQSRENGGADIEKIVAKCNAAGVKADVNFNTKQTDEDTFAVVAITCEVNRSEFLVTACPV